ncbi:MAG: hypothetical protein KDB07_08205 [Planctomycetes bacterium]|nr:hypothetical protein [Planctomycetota bacterium]
MGMFCGLIKTGLVVAVIGGGAVLVGTMVMGEERVRDLFTSARGELNERVDSLIDERHVLEERIEQVRQTYPKEIAGLKTQIKDAEYALAEAEKEMTSCAAMIEIANEDVAALTIAAQADDGLHRFNGRIYNERELHKLMDQSERASEDYRLRYNRLADERDLLKEQVRQMREEMEALRTEFQAFEAEYRTIQRNLDQIERNEKIIALSERRTHSRESAKRKQLVSLEDVQRRIDAVRTEQEERLRMMRGVGQGVDSYEARARERIAKGEASVKAAN